MDVKEIVDKHGRASEHLLEVLMECQQQSDKSYLSQEVVFEISQEMNIPESQVVGVASFYSLLSTSPRGKHIIQICNDVPCYINGSMNLVKELEKLLDIKMCSTTEDGLFTLEFTSCLGCCEIAPAIQIGGKVYGNLTPEKLSDIINEYRGQ